MDSLPTFIIIGAMKSGSSSLHNYLAQHPEIMMSDPKEVNYFIKELNWKKGLNWYKSLFACPEPIKGESSIGYTKCEEYSGVPKRIHQLLPDVKLIYLMREPISRARSHFADDLLYQQHNTGQYPDINESFLQPGNKYVSTSKYHMQLEKYLEYFSLDQMLLLTTEDLREKPGEVLNRVLEFVGASPLKGAQLDAITAGKYNVSEKKEIKGPFYKRLTNNAIVRQAKQALPEKLVESLVSSKAYRSLTKKSLKSLPLELEKDTYAQVKEILYRDVEKLELVTERNFHKWRQRLS